MPRHLRFPRDTRDRGGKNDDAHRLAARDRHGGGAPARPGARWTGGRRAPRRATGTFEAGKAGGAENIEDFPDFTEFVAARQGHLRRIARAGLPTEERSALFEALQALPLQQRKVVVLRHWWGLSVRKTASELGISEGPSRATATAD